MTRDQQAPGSVAEISAALLSSAVYSRYAELSHAHLEKNPRCAAITEHIKPLLTGSVLRGDGKIGLRTDTFFVVDDRFLQEFRDIDVQPDDNNTSYTFMHLGHQLSGHPKIVHGGLLATILDETTCRLGFQNCAAKKGVTANLNLHYHKPCPTDSYVLVRCRVTKKERRKCWVRGEVFAVDLDAGPGAVERDDNLLTSCECLIIEPRPA